MNVLTVNDFEHKSEYFSFEGHTKMWNTEEVRLSIDFPENRNREECLKNYIDSINEQLVWLNTNKRKIEEYLIAEDFIDLAQDWASSAEEAEDEEQECYIMEDGAKVFLPVTENDFCNSLNMSSIGLNYEDNLEKPKIEIYLVCRPDYFACHAINIDIDGDKNITFASLAG